MIESIDIKFVLKGICLDENSEPCTSGYALTWKFLIQI
jgi:hypothetical protein